MTAPANAESDPLLRVQDLTIGVRHSNSPDVTLVHGVSFDIHASEKYGVVGESGSGKSMTLRAIAGLLPAGVEVFGGDISYRGESLLGMSERRRRAIMGPDIAMIFQEPMTALNPTMRVGQQIAEGPRRHLGMSAGAARALAIDMMRATGIPDPERRARAYPHELSGGLRQRIMIAMALSCEPRLVLCDEPTTALDVTVQDQVLRLLARLCDQTGAALAFVTHDLAVVAQTCTQMSVMYAGRIVESASTRAVLSSSLHPYTEGLLRSAPDLDDPDRRIQAIPGSPPQLARLPAGCSFAPRCEYAVDACRSGSKPLVDVGDAHLTACDRWEQIYRGAS